MKSRFSSLTSRALGRAGRRPGYTLTEVAVASALVVMVLTAVTAILSMAGTMQQVVTLQTDADQGAVRAMNRMILEVREAKEVSIPSDSSFTVYFPVIRPDGHYDRFVTDYNNWIKYYRSTSNGTASPTGKYLWRTSSGGAAKWLATDVKNFRVIQNSTNSIRLTVELEKVSGSRKGDTQLTERVLYLRNN
jgi:type II secretory pathway pseudopilin PulG